MPAFSFNSPEPPVRTPPNWSGGEVQSLGGGMQGRIWYHDSFPLHVIYNNSDAGVSLIVHEPGKPGHVIDEEHARMQTANDDMLANQAVHFMENWQRFVDVPKKYRKNDVGSDTGFVFGDSFGAGGDLDF